MRPTSKGIPNREVANLKWDDVPIQYRPRTRSRTKPPSIVEDPELALRVLRELDSDHEERERIPSAPRVRGERPPIPHVKDIFRPPGETPPRKHRQSRNFSTPSPRTNREMEDVSENSGGTVVHRHRGPQKLKHHHSASVAHFSRPLTVNPTPRTCKHPFKSGTTPPRPKSRHMVTPPRPKSRPGLPPPSVPRPKSRHEFFPPRPKSRHGFPPQPSRTRPVTAYPQPTHDRRRARRPSEPFENPFATPAHQGNTTTEGHISNPAGSAISSLKSIFGFGKKGKTGTWRTDDTAESDDDEGVREVGGRKLRSWGFWRKRSAE